MEPKKLTEYERKRLENIKRNEEMISSLNLLSKAQELSDASKRQRVVSKSYKIGPEEKPKTQEPVVIRRSLRTQGKQAEFSEGLKDHFTDSAPDAPKSYSIRSNDMPHKLGPISMSDAYCGIGSDRTLIETIAEISKKSQLSGCEDESIGGCVTLGSMSLKPENVARVVHGKIMIVRFLPSSDRRVILAGNKFGDVGFWNVDCEDEEDSGVYLYSPHTSPITGISVQQSSGSKIFTSCYDGFIRMLDAEKEVFNLVYSSDDSIFSLSQRPDEAQCLYFGDGHRGLNMWDERVEKCPTQWVLHDGRINSIDFNSENYNIMATSSTDRTACIWDLRSMDADKPKALKIVEHKRAVHSAYFSPSGNFLATTSVANTVGIMSGDNFEDISMIFHNDQIGFTGRRISSFRAIWGWDDSYLFVGNMKKGVDVISPARKRTIMTLQSPYISAIPCRLDAHPFKVGMLAGATSGGQVYMWTSC